ncbi:MAG TPA: mycofactocin-associated electron transfer flavoprotein alpha subunit [Ilumatobacteraceae bacterium]
MLAVVVVRDGVLPAGGAETISECEGRAMFIGSGTAAAGLEVRHIASEVTIVEVGDFQPAAWTEAVASRLAEEDILVLPASPDGRDLAPRLAARLQRPLYAMCMKVSSTRVDMVRGSGTELHSFQPPRAFVATLQPGVRGVDQIAGRTTTLVYVVEAERRDDATMEALLPADAATIDLSEASRIVAGGAGLDGQGRMVQLAALGTALGASVGATRVVTDRGWAPHERQIGTTGVVVAPQLYIAFGISGAVQHTSGLGQPDHIISINVDPHCPMMQLADLAVVGDANEVLDELLRQVGAANG